MLFQKFNRFASTRTFTLLQIILFPSSAQGKTLQGLGRKSTISHLVVHNCHQHQSPLFGYQGLMFILDVHNNAKKLSGIIVSQWPKDEHTVEYWNTFHQILSLERKTEGLSGVGTDPSCWWYPKEMVRHLLLPKFLEYPFFLFQAQFSSLFFFLLFLSDTS